MAYIEKGPIIEFITKGLNNPDKTKAFGYDAIEILTEIEYAPTADVVEVRHGEWIRPTIIHGMIIAGLPHCSVCGEVPCDEGKYCPHCGTKMDGG